MSISLFCNSCLYITFTYLFIFNFYWTVVDLQCCVSFRCTAKWIGYAYTYIHPFLDSFPVQAIIEYWVEFPVLYSRSLLVTCFIHSSVYVSIPISGQNLEVSLCVSLFTQPTPHTSSSYRFYLQNISRFWRSLITTTTAEIQALFLSHLEMQSPPTWSFGFSTYSVVVVFIGV